VRIRPSCLNATKAIRKMRGEAQAHLVECDDGHAYVLKLPGNPQGTRILVNELVAAVLLGELGIAAPQPAIVRIDEIFLKENLDVAFRKGDARIEVQPGLCFGSRYPGCPGSFSVFDFLPNVMLSQVSNLSHFCGALLVDKWLSNADRRQAVFFRNTTDKDVGRWIVQMIDNGMAFQGSDWTFRASAIQGLYAQLIVYGKCPAARNFEPWIDRLESLERGLLEDAFDLIPPTWLQGDGPELVRLLRRLYARRERVPELLASALCGIREQSRRFHPTEPNFGRRPPAKSVETRRAVMAPADCA